MTFFKSILPYLLAALVAQGAVARPTPEGVMDSISPGEAPIQCRSTVPQEFGLSIANVPTVSKRQGGVTQIADGQVQAPAIAAAVAPEAVGVAPEAVGVAPEAVAVAPESIAAPVAPVAVAAPVAPEVVAAPVAVPVGSSSVSTSTTSTSATLGEAASAGASAAEAAEQAANGEIGLTPEAYGGEGAVPAVPVAPAASGVTQITDGQIQAPAPVAAAAPAVVAPEAVVPEAAIPVAVVPEAVTPATVAPATVAPAAVAPVAVAPVAVTPEAAAVPEVVASSVVEGNVPQTPAGLITGTAAAPETAFVEAAPAVEATTVAPVVEAAPVAFSAPVTGGVTQIGDGQIQAPALLRKRQNGPPLRIKLRDGILTDSEGRTGYVADNRQLQFDAPPQAGALYTTGFSVCPDQSLALGGQDTFYACGSSDFNNLYDQEIYPDNCVPVKIQMVD